eukprot:TRINITY_DN12280_c0_g2_i1.p1 TRINITY_DN12280_c0_g2~~TRINITY_DN12280_c0_g2_i1.p1  ORF type:complete len:173 (+),score=14.34 TRINITY_DN12280_c0_g2_i1:139-657(+)
MCIRDSPSSSSLSYPLEQDFLASGLDSALDVWMLGCALFEVICGVHPLSIIRTLEPSNSITGIKIPANASSATTATNPGAGGSGGLSCCVTECLDYYAMHIKTTYTQEDLRSTMDNHPHPVSYTHLRAHETPEHLVCRLLLEKKKKIKYKQNTTTYINKYTTQSDTHQISIV